MGLRPVRPNFRRGVFVIPTSLSILNIFFGFRAIIYSTRAIEAISVGRNDAAMEFFETACLSLLFAAVAGSGLATDLVKWIVGRSRPGRFDIDGVLSFTPFASDSIFFSFPSGHATSVTAAALAAILFMRRFRWLGVALLAFAAVVAVSRIAVRAHFPSDVIGGIAIGASFTYGLAHVLGRTGVAFQRLPEGGLMAKTMALRGVFRTRGGARRMARALAAAFRAGRRGGR